MRMVRSESIDTRGGCRYISTEGSKTASTIDFRKLNYRFYLGMDGYWCTPRTSNPLAGTNTIRGEFDPHPFPQEKCRTDI